MTASATPAPAAATQDKRIVALDFDLAAPPEKVWRALTEADLLAKWLMPNDFVARVGHRFQFRSQPYGGWNGIVDCEVLEVTPPTRIRLAWGGVAGALGNTTVTWTLTPTAGGTRLHLEQAPFGPDAARFRNGAIMGWNNFFGQQLPKLLPNLK